MSLPGRSAVYVSTLTWSASGGVYTPALSGTMLATLQGINAACTNKGALTWDRIGYSWMDGWVGGGGGYSHLMAPNSTLWNTPITNHSSGKSNSLRIMIANAAMIPPIARLPVSPINTCAG